MNIEEIMQRGTDNVVWCRAYYRERYKFKKNNREDLSEWRKYRKLTTTPIYVEVNPILYFDE